MRFPALPRVLFSLVMLSLGASVLGSTACTIDDEAAPSCTQLGGTLNGSTCVKSAVGSGGTGGQAPNSLAGTCYAPAGCQVLPENKCLAKVDNTASTRKTLRMSQLRVKTPAVLSNSFVQFTIVGPAVTQYDPTCLPGDANKGGLFNWLVDIDTEAKTLRTGGARAVDDINAGYCFLSADFSGITVAPIVANIDYDASTGAFATIDTIARLAVPIFQKRSADDVPIILPLLTATITNGSLSPDGNCIGQYRGDPGVLDGDCAPQSDKATDDDAYSFVNGATISGKISLEEADQVKVIDLSGSLCVLLTNAGVKDASGYSMCERNPDGTFTDKVLKVTKKTDGTFVTTDDGKPAVALTADFAASAITIKDDSECQ